MRTVPQHIDQRIKRQYGERFRLVWRPALGPEPAAWEVEAYIPELRSWRRAFTYCREGVPVMELGGGDDLMRALDEVDTLKGPGRDAADAAMRHYDRIVKGRANRCKAELKEWAANVDADALRHLIRRDLDDVNLSTVEDAEVDYRIPFFESRNPAAAG